MNLIGKLAVVIVALAGTSIAQADLISRLGGAAAYDDVLDITWVTTADLSNQQLGGTATWQQQVDWAAGLDYLGFNDWRLASMSVAAGLPTGAAANDDIVNCRHDNGTPEVACRDNELGYMFYHNLGGNWGDDLRGNQTADGVDLTAIQQLYWSGTETGFDPTARYFNFFNGNNISDPKISNFSGWAVRDGDVLSVPEPSTLALLGIGLLGMGLSRRRKKA